MTRDARLTRDLTTTPAPGRAATRAPAPQGATHPLAELQQAIGNQAVLHMLGGSGRPAPDGDAHERAADRLAEHVAGRVRPQRTSAATPAGDGARPIPPALRAQLSPGFGADLTGVRLHTGAAAGARARTLDARAFTTGRDIFFGAGEYDPGSAEGVRLLAHELAHVSQQARGEAPALIQCKKGKKKQRDTKVATQAVLDQINKVKTHFGVNSAEELNQELIKRVPDGPPLSQAELALIQAIDDTDPGAVEWLEATGLGTYDAADTYTQAGNYRTWLTLDPAKRLLCASIAWANETGRNADNPPPDYTLGRHMAIKSNQARPYEQQERDAQIRKTFISVLRPGSEEQTLLQQWKNQGIKHGTREHTVEAAKILSKVFVILHAGLEVYDPAAAQHVKPTQDVARALAHGGRVNIRIPALRKGEHEYDLTDWLGITKVKKGRVHHEARGPVSSRSFGTHHMSIGKNQPGQPGRFVEKGGGAANRSNMKDMGVKLYGMNVAAGGLGRQDFNGTVIMPDGGHGHLFIGLTMPTKEKDGALQIGMETTAPMKSEMSPVGYIHDAHSTEATANPESSFYGHKSAKIGGGGLGTNQRLVDLNALEASSGKRWEAALDDIADQLDQTLQQAATMDAAYEMFVGPRLL